MDLFTVEESLSPCLKWMREHEISIIEPGADCDQYAAESNAFDENSPDRDTYPETGFGPDEESALIDFARKNRIKLWNEP
ncbi:MAG: hypothetical protein QM755_23800 [Luteolibacter sp.]